MIPQTIPLNKRSRGGFSMIEVTLALGIVSFAILTTLGLLAVGLDVNRDSVYNTEAASVAREVAADLQMMEDWSDTANLSPRFQIPAPPPSGSTAPETLYVTRAGSYLDGGSITDAERISALFRVDVSFGPTSGALPPVIHILVSWPTGLAGDGAWPNTESTSYEVIASLSPL
jgi:uncharacterized protein (TIGR02598 family)